MADEPSPKTDMGPADGRGGAGTAPPGEPETGSSAQWVPFLVLGFALTFGLTVGTLGLTRIPFVGGGVEQPIEFSHRLHVEDLALGCDTCHQFYATQARSGLPDADTCGFCHLEAQGESAEEARLVALLEEGEPLRWQSLFRQPAHVFYSHSRHVTVAGLECERCHGDIAHTEAPPRRVERLTMELCIDCHESGGARTDCTACHR